MPWAFWSLSRGQRGFYRDHWWIKCGEDEEIRSKNELKQKEKEGKRREDIDGTWWLCWWLVGTSEFFTIEDLTTHHELKMATIDTVKKGTYMKWNKATGILAMCARPQYQVRVTPGQFGLIFSFILDSIISLGTFPPPINTT